MLPYADVRCAQQATLKLNVISRNGHMGLLVYNGAGGLIQARGAYVC
jgi:hypothetical protein